jgi:hypothetical protein
MESECLINQSELIFTIREINDEIIITSPNDSLNKLRTYCTYAKNHHETFALNVDSVSHLDFSWKEKNAEKCYYPNSSKSYYKLNVSIPNIDRPYMSIRFGITDITVSIWFLNKWTLLAGTFKSSWTDRALILKQRC